MHRSQEKAQAAARRSADAPPKAGPVNRVSELIGEPVAVLTGPTRIRYNLGGGRLAEVDTIVTSPEEWPTRAESRDPSWVTTPHGTHLLAQRLYC